MMAGQDMIRAQALACGLEQDALQLSAVDRELRPVVAGRHAAGFRPDALAVFAVIGEFRRRDGGFSKGVEQIRVR